MGSRVTLVCGLVAWLPGSRLGRFASIDSVGSEVRLLRGEGSAVIIQVCHVRLCREASVDPRELVKAVYSVAGDVLGEDFVEILERARDALWSQLLADRAAFTIVSGMRDAPREDVEATAARLVLHWDAFRMLEDLIAFIRSTKPSDLCKDSPCVEAAREVVKLMDERLGADKILDRWIPRRKR